MKSVNREVGFQCPKCPKQYTTQYALVAHMNVSHDEVKRYQCYFCSLATSTKSNLIRHMSKHTHERPFKCQTCCQWYRKEASVKRHKDGNSCLTFPLLLSPCYFCFKLLPNNRRLKAHMKMVHLKEDYYKRCNLCRKYFSTTPVLNNHIRSVHLLEGNYKCQLCSRKLASNGELKYHIQSVHTKEKPFKCYFCSKSFVTLGVLKRHMLIHTGEKPLSCYFCQKDFSVSDDLSIHIRSKHTKERPFKCKKCPSRCYATKRSLNSHVRKKHGM
jgi:KRAB domain-containing zinc finger protein